MKSDTGIERMGQWCVKTQDVWKENQNFDKVLLKIVKKDKTVEKSFKEICKRLFVKTNGQTFIETKLDL